eukprot:scaffold2489_cov110-Isochrysis_galbana.AAC.4
MFELRGLSAFGYHLPASSLSELQAALAAACGAVRYADVHGPTVPVHAMMDWLRVAGDCETDC